MKRRETAQKMASRRVMSHLILLLGIWYLLLGNIAFGQTSSSVQDESLGLLPPASSDRSPLAAEIREALASRRFRTAIELSQKLIDLEPASYEGFMWRGFLELQGRNTVQATRYLRLAQAREARPAVLKMLAVSYYIARQYRLFIATMEAAIQMQPGDFAPYYYLGRYYNSEVDDFTKATELLTKALEREPNHLRSRYHLGYCLEAKRELQQAARQYEEAIRIAEGRDERFALPYQGLARIRLLLSQPAEALGFARKAIAIDPDDAESYRSLAKAFTRLGNNAEAARALEKVADLEPADAAVHYQLFRLYSKSNEKKKAQAALEQYRKLSAIYGRG